MLGLVARGRRRARASPSSPPRRCSTAPSRSSGRCWSASPPTGRSSSRSRTSTGRTRPRCSCSNASSRTPRTAACCSSSPNGSNATTRPGRAGHRRARAPASNQRDRARGALGGRRPRAAPRARRSGDAAGRRWSGDPRAGRRESFLPRGDGPVAGRRRRAGAGGRRMALRPRGRVEVPATVEKVILARIDRLRSRRARRADGRVGARPPVRPVAARGRRRRRARSSARSTSSSASTWSARVAAGPPEYRFKHALIQEAAYRTLVADQRTALHRRAADWLEARTPGARTRSRACWRTTGSPPPTRTRRSRTSPAPPTERGRSTRSTRRSSTTVSCSRSSSAAAIGTRVALVLFKLALALHVSLRFAEANDTYQRAFEHLDAADGPPSPDRHPAGRHELPAERPRPAIGDRVAEHPAVHAAVRSPGRGMARANDRAVAGRTVGDLRRRPPVRVPPARGPPMVGRRAAHRARRRVRHQTRARSGRPGLVGRDLLRARERAGLLPATQR